MPAGGCTAPSAPGAMHLDESRARECARARVCGPAIGVRDRLALEMRLSSNAAHSRAPVGMLRERGPFFERPMPRN